MSDEKQTPKHSVMSPSLQLARLSRLAKTMELDLRVQDGLAREVEVSLLQAPVAVVEAAQPQSIEREMLQIRGLIELDRPWEEIEPLAWQAFGRNPTEELAAAIVELVYLHGGSSRLAEVLQAFRRLGIGFYFAVKAELRSLIVSQLWAEGQQQLVNRFVHAPQFERELVPVEMLFKFWSLHSSRDPRRCFNFFQQHEVAIVAAVVAFGERLGLALPQLYLTVGRLGIELGYEVLARRALIKIDEQDTEYAEAMQLLLQLRIERDENGHCVYGRRLAALGAWMDRINMLERFLVDAKHLTGLADIHRPALNSLLEDPLKWVPGIPEAWGQMAQMLVRYLDLESYVPNVYKIFEGRALQIMPVALERALWMPLEDASSGDIRRDQYWSGIAMLHRYICSEAEHEKSLWEARERVQAATAHSAKHLPFPWPRLMRNIEKWLAKTPVLDEKKRQLMLAQVRMAQDDKSVELADVANYLQISQAPDYRILSTVVSVCRSRSMWRLELEALHKRGQYFTYTNDDLNRLWQLSLQLDDHDIAWRIATVLHSRGYLHEDVMQRWSFSGEMRNDYGFSALARSDIEMILRRFHGEQRKFLESLVDVGPLIPELLSYLHEGKLRVRKTEPLSGTRAADVKEFLDRLLWMPLGKKSVEPDLSGDDILGVRLPCFVQVMPHNCWSEMVVYLGVRLGLSAWEWNVGRLHSSIASMLPLAISGNIDNAPVKVGRWLKQLTAEQRLAWQNLIGSSGQITPEEGVPMLASFLACLAISLYQNHVAALNVMRKMRVDWSVIQLVEKWLLSDDYSRLRRKLGTQNRIKVPHTLLKLETITSHFQQG